MSVDDSRFWEKTSINVLANVLRTVLTALVGILLVPFYIESLGMATYGLIPLATTMTSYIMIISDALVSACSRYTTVAIQKDDTAEMNRTFNTALFGIGKNLLLMIPLVLIFSWATPYVFNIDGTAATDVQWMFLLILMSAVIVTFSSAFNSIFNAYNKLYQLYLARTIYLLVHIGLIFVLFWGSTPSLVSVGFAYLVSSIILFVMVYRMSTGSCPELRIDHDGYDSAMFRQMGSLGAWTIVLKIGSLLFIQISLVITNICLGADAQSGFAIVTSLISMVNTACYSMVAAVTPLIFKEYSDDDRDGLIEISRTAVKCVSLLFAMPIAFVMIYASQILTAWVGADCAYLSGLVFIAFFAELSFCAVMVLEDIPVVFLKVHLVGISTVIFGIMNVIMALISVTFTDLGTDGVMIAWTVAILSMNVFLAIFNARLTGTSWYRYLVPILEGYILMGICATIFRAISGMFVLRGAWIPILIFFLVSFAIYFLIMMFFVNREERALICRMMPDFVTRHLPKFIRGE